MKKRKNVPFSKILDSLDNKYHNFDGEGYEEEHYDYADGSSHESTASVKLYKADPYQIVIENKNEQRALKAIIFGNNKYLLQPRFGSDNGIVISIGQPGVEYVELLQQSSTKPFATQFMRIESENPLQVTKFITVHQKDANGNSFTRPMNMGIHKSAYQQDKNMLDVPINEEVDGSTYWEIEIEPKTRVFYTIFPSYKVDTASTLKGKGPIKSYAQANINTAGLVGIPHGKKLLKGG